MEFEELSNLIFSELRPKIENHNGLSIFARRRSSFEGWIKVELCDTLVKYFGDVTPEKETVDICFGGWKVELKVITTNIGSSGKNITQQIRGVINDIQDLKKIPRCKKGVLFVVVPAIPENKSWKNQINKISVNLSGIKSCPIVFKNGVPGIIYFGYI